MSRALAYALLVAVVLSGVAVGTAPPAPATSAQVAGATPGAATPIPEARPLLDLAWTVVAPDDLAAPGYGFGQSGYRQLAEFGDAFFRGEAESRFGTAAARAGYRQGYAATVARPGDEDPSYYGRAVRTAVAQFRDEAGAERAFAAMGEGFDDVGQARTQTEPEIGDAAAAFRYSGTSASGFAYEELRVMVRSGDAVAVVATIDWEGGVLLLSEGVALADVVVRRIEAARRGDSPSLGLAIQRLGGDWVEVDVDRFRRRAGHELPYYRQSASSLANLRGYHEDAAITDEYTFEASWADPTNSAVAATRYSSTVALFADEAAARAGFAAWATQWLESPPSTVHDVAEVDLPVVGVDEAATLAYAVDLSSGETAHGYLTLLRAGPKVLELVARAAPGISRHGHAELVERNAACLRQPRCSFGIPPGPGLVGEPAAATPAPSPAVPALEPAAGATPGALQAALPAVVQIGVALDLNFDGLARQEVVPVGSGTVVSPDGLVLTNWHVVDPLEFVPPLAAERAARGDESVVQLADAPLRILVTGGVRPPEAAYAAVVVARDPGLDLAVLRIVADADGKPIDPAALNLPYVPLGDSARLLIGDRLDVLGYPAIGGGGLLLTGGRVSGFYFSESLGQVSWIVSDAVTSGGSSGGAALDAAGRLVGVPSASPPLDCEPGDTNRDGVVDDRDLGCIPHGGSVSAIRPIDLAKPLLEEARAAAGAATPAASPSAGGTPGAQAVAVTAHDIFFDPKELITRPTRT